MSNYRIYAAVSMLLAGCFLSIYALDGSVLSVVTSTRFGFGPLVRIDLPSKSRTTIDSDPTSYGPAFSPDGARIAYVKSTGIWLTDRDGGNKVNQNVPINSSQHPALSWVTRPDGDYIYWSEEGMREIWRTKVGSGQRELVRQCQADVRLSRVSADGTRAAFTRCCYLVVAVDLTTGVERNIGGGGGCQGTVSPNGTYITRNLGSHTEAVIHTWDGGEYRRLTTPWGKFNKHRFSSTSENHVVYHVTSDDRGINPTGYVCDIHTSERWECGPGDPYDFFLGSVVVNPTVANPVISPDGGSFEQSSVNVTITSETAGATIRYTTDGSQPAANHGTAIASGTAFTLQLPESGEVAVKACAIKEGSTPSAVVTARFYRVTLRDPDNPSGTVNGLEYSCYEGDGWIALPDFTLLTPVSTGTTDQFDLDVRTRNDGFGIVFEGYLSVQQDGIYTFYTESDDGSRLSIGTEIVVDNDGVHAVVEQSGTIGLKAGKHAFVLEYFDGIGGEALTVSYEGPGLTRIEIPAAALYRDGGTEPAYTVTSPAAGQVVTVGDVLTIRWDANLDIVGDASVLFSPDGGDHWTTLSREGSIAPGTPLWSNFTWTIPDTVYDDALRAYALAGSDQGIVRVKEYMGDLYDDIDGPIVIQGSADAGRMLRTVPQTAVLRVQGNARGADIVLSGVGRCVLEIVNASGCLLYQSRVDAATQHRVPVRLSASGILIARVRADDGTVMERRFFRSR